MSNTKRDNAYEADLREEILSALDLYMYFLDKVAVDLNEETEATYLQAKEKLKELRSHILNVEANGLYDKREDVLAMIWKVIYDLTSSMKNKHSEEIAEVALKSKKYLEDHGLLEIKNEGPVALH